MVHNLYAWKEMTSDNRFIVAYSIIATYVYIAMWLDLKTLSVLYKVAKFNHQNV